MATERELPASRKTLHAEGKARRRSTPRSALAIHADGPRDPLGILERQNAARLPDLVPLRRERMSASPFAFYRGTAALMAADLADAPHSGILVASCGDAHVSNFGFYASPERELVFDLNDFDEAAWAPWEWDVKRLVTSVIIGGRATSRADEVVHTAARTAISTYVRGMRAVLRLSPTERYFTHFNVRSSRASLDPASQKAIRRSVKQAQKRTGERAVQRLTEVGDDGHRRFVHSPPTMGPVPDEMRAFVHRQLDAFRASATPDVRLLLEHYDIADVARRVVGVGSVGTRCYLALLEDGDGSTLLMQPKEAAASVLVEYGRMPQPEHLRQGVEADGEGARVVAMQRILQALSDPFLGHLRSPDADFYVRQFHDMKGGIEVEELDDQAFATYAQACAAVLARAHSQSPGASRVVGYVGDGVAATEALLTWSYEYAEVSARDFEAFLAA
ncbi:DUF2252 domain-containing protein [Microbacterium sp.]|uniref:DUF2252 domain-containing protein n=1 Tax=Microbacterium sp. TaxID=51671 RepID=UPI00334092E7